MVCAFSTVFLASPFLPGPANLSTLTTTINNGRITYSVNCRVEKIRFCKKINSNICSNEKIGFIRCKYNVFFCGFHIFPVININSENNLYCLITRKFWHFKKFVGKDLE